MIEPVKEAKEVSLYKIVEEKPVDKPVDSSLISK
jgi:hypothetical protein